MKRTFLMTTVALFIAGAAAPSFADTASVGATGQAGTSAAVGSTAAKVGATVDSNTTVNTGDKTTAGANANFGTLMSAITADASTAASIQEMTNVSSVKVVKVSALAEGNNQEAVKAALDTNKSAVAKLQAAIAANANLKAKLNEKSVKLSSVVALNMDASGTVIVFVD